MVGQNLREHLLITFFTERIKNQIAWSKISIHVYYFCWAYFSDTRKWLRLILNAAGAFQKVQKEFEEDSWVDLTWNGFDNHFVGLFF